MIIRIGSLAMTMQKRAKQGPKAMRAQLANSNKVITMIDYNLVADDEDNVCIEDVR